MNESSTAERARAIQAQMPEGGLFAGHSWRISPEAFPLGRELGHRLENLGRSCLRFYQAVNKLYHLSVAGDQPGWVARWLDQGKPEHLINRQRSAPFREAAPRVIRPDVLLTEDGLAITELDSIPGGIGLTAWLNEVYAGWEPSLAGGAQGMLEGWASIFGEAQRVIVVLSEESKTYRPEMEWLCQRLNARAPHGRPHFVVRDEHFFDFQSGDAVYRFFELFDLGNIPSAQRLFELSGQGCLSITPAPKAMLEEKLLFALLWNLNLREFWRAELGEALLHELFAVVPRTWAVDPAPMPPQGAIPGLEIINWAQLKAMSQRERNLVLKVSGFSPEAHSSRGVQIGSDLSAGEWGRAVDEAIAGFGHSPRVIQRFHKPRLVNAPWYDFERDMRMNMSGRVRLCPYYFVAGEGAETTVRLGGCLATICPEDKKIIHGMSVAILAPCSMDEPKNPPL